MEIQKCFSFQLHFGFILHVTFCCAARYQWKKPPLINSKWSSKLLKQNQKKNYETIHSQLSINHIQKEVKMILICLIDSTKSLENPPMTIITFHCSMTNPLMQKSRYAELGGTSSVFPIILLVYLFLSYPPSLSLFVLCSITVVSSLFHMLKMFLLLR